MFLLVYSNKKLKFTVRKKKTVDERSASWQSIPVTCWVEGILSVFNTDLTSRLSGNNSEKKKTRAAKCDLDLMQNTMLCFSHRRAQIKKDSLWINKASRTAHKYFFHI